MFIFIAGFSDGDKSVFGTFLTGLVEAHLIASVYLKPTSSFRLIRESLSLLPRFDLEDVD